MSTRSKAQEDILSKQLAEILENQKSQLTKDHFDSEVNAIKDTLRDHTNEINQIKTRLEAVENRPDNDPNGIYKELYEQEVRKNNIIIFKMPEQTVGNKLETSNKERQAINEMFMDMKLIDTEDDEISFRFTRLGKNPNTDNPRPLKIIFNNCLVKGQIFKAAKNLKGLGRWKKVSITGDMTTKQRELRKIKWQELQKEANNKNNARTENDIEQGLVYKVLGNYGTGNLRVQKTKTADK